MSEGGDEEDVLTYQVSQLSVRETFKHQFNPMKHSNINLTVFFNPTKTKSVTTSANIELVTNFAHLKGGGGMGHVPPLSPS